MRNPASILASYSLRSWWFCGRSMNMKAAKPRKRVLSRLRPQTPTKPPATQAKRRISVGCLNKWPQRENLDVPALFTGILKFKFL